MGPQLACWFGCSAMQAGATLWLACDAESRHKNTSPPPTFFSPVFDTVHKPPRGGPSHSHKSPALTTRKANERSITLLIWKRRRSFASVRCNRPNERVK
jgi:hypothetical protein